MNVEERGTGRASSGIVARAAEVARRHADLNLAYAARDGSLGGDEAWRTAARVFRDAVDTFYGPYVGIGRRIRNGDAGATDDAIRFLEADPRCFRSGYLKADLMGALANVPLGDPDRARLRIVVVQRLARPEAGLLRSVSQLAANVWDDDLAERVAVISAGGSAAQHRDAFYLLDAVEQKRRTIAGVERKRRSEA